MFKDIVRNSINAMKGDNKIIRLTWFTSFFHSLIVMLLMIVNLNALLARHYENGLYVGKVAQFFIEDIAKNHFIRTTIMITIGLFLLYSIIYPIGQGAIIHYLHDKTKNMRSALRKGRQDFFALFEFSFISLLFAPVVYFFMVFKVLIIDSNTSWQALMRLSILGLVMIAVNGLKTYTRYFIVIRKMPLQEALKESILMAGKRRGETSKYMRIQTILLINFSLNLFIIIGLPFGLVYLSIVSNIIDYTWVKVIIYAIFFIMTIFGSYMSAIIRAFFAYYWYEIYQKNNNK